MPDRSPGEQIDAIYRTVPIGLCVLDRDLRYVRINDQLALMNGIPAADHIGRRVFDLHPGLAQTVEPLFQRVLESGESILHQELMGRPGTHVQPRTFVLHCVPVRDADGAVAGINVAVEDITERREAEARLRTLERRLWMQTENSPLAVVEWDSTYRVTRWAGAAEAMFGWRAEEVVGRRIDELDIVVEEDWPLVQDTMRQLSAAHERYVVSSNRNYTRDRHVITCEWYNSIVTGADGELAAVLSLVLDVTEQRRTTREQKLLGAVGRLLAEPADLTATLETLTCLPVPDFADWSALDMVDAHGHLESRTIAWRPSATQCDVVLRTYRGNSPALQSTLCGDDVLRTGRAAITKSCACGGLRETLLSEGDAAPPLPSSASVLTVPLRLEERVMAAWSWGRSGQEEFDDRDLALAQELARRVGTVILNTRLLDAVQRTNRIKDEFLATLAHELHQPLGALTTALGVLRLAGESRASERAWHIAERQLEFLARITDDLMDLSRIERGKITLAKDRLDLHRILETAIEVNEHLVRSRLQHFLLDVPDEPIPIVGDSARLQQVFSNLLNNASKFTAEGGTIGIAVILDAGQVQVTVHDSGRGIPADQLETIFEPFAQGVARVGDGLGIGLAVVRQLAQLHGGQVYARSAGEGHGSEFVVTLPLAEAGEVSVKAETAGRNSQSSRGPLPTP